MRQCARAPEVAVRRRAPEFDWWPRKLRGVPNHALTRGGPAARILDLPMRRVPPALQLCALQFASQLLSGTSDAQVDWLIAKPSSTSTFTAAACWPEYGMDPPICVLELSNGLISRRWVASPGFGTIDMVLNATAEFGGE